MDGDIARSLCNVLYQLSGVGAPSALCSLLLKLGCCYPVVHCQVLGMYFKELHTCLVNGALLRLLLVINFPMEMVTWIKIQDCACLQD